MRASLRVLERGPKQSLSEQEMVGIASVLEERRETSEQVEARWLKLDDANVGLEIRPTEHLPRPTNHELIGRGIPSHDGAANGTLEVGGLGSSRAVARRRQRRRRSKQGGKEHSERRFIRKEGALEEELNLAARDATAWVRAASR
jgi:hypothetical protein